MLALQCMHANLLKIHGFCWALHAKLYPSVKIDREGQGQNKIGGAPHIYVMLVVQCMHDHLLKMYSFYWVLYVKWYLLVRIDEKVQVKDDLGKRLYGGQGQHRIGCAHLGHVGIAMHV